MAEGRVTAPFPTPPPFWKHFTPQNLAHWKQREQDSAPPTESPSAPAISSVDVVALPPELRYLSPPEPPTDGKYRSFGAEYNLNAPDRTLKDAGIDQLYPDEDSAQLNPTPHLLNLSRSVLTTFLSLTGILAQDPTQFESRTNDLQTIMYNMHHLINLYRPHQARESLILMMEEQLARMRKEIEDVNAAKGKVADVLQQLQELGVSEGGVAKLNGHVHDEDSRAWPSEQKRRQRQRACWAVIDEMLPPSKNPSPDDTELT